MNESKNKKATGVKRKQKADKKDKEAKPAPAPKNAKSPKVEPKKATKPVIPEKKGKKTENKKSTKEETKEVVAPKRSWPAFFFFQNEKRLQLKRDNPSLSQKDLVSKLGELWRGLSESDKKPYIDQERKDKARYMKEKEEFKATNKSLPPAKKKDKKGKAKSPAKGPKRAWPPFFFFQEQRREDLKKENPDLNHKEIVSKLGEEWRQMSDDAKQPFVEKSVQDQKRYDKEKREYQDTLPAEAKDASSPNEHMLQTSSAKTKREAPKDDAKKTAAKKQKKKPKAKSVKPPAARKNLKRPVPPPRPAGSRHSKRIKKNEEEQYIEKVKEYQEVKGEIDPDLEKVLNRKDDDKASNHSQEPAAAPAKAAPTRPAKAKKASKVIQNKDDMEVDKPHKAAKSSAKTAKTAPKDEVMEAEASPADPKPALKPAEVAPEDPADESKDADMDPVEENREADSGEAQEQPHTHTEDVAADKHDNVVPEPPATEAGKPVLVEQGHHEADASNNPSVPENDAEEHKHDPSDVSENKPVTEAGKPVLVEQDHPKLATSNNPSNPAGASDNAQHNPNVTAAKTGTPVKPAKGKTSTPTKSLTKSPAKAGTPQPADATGAEASPVKPAEDSKAEEPEVKEDTAAAEKPAVETEEHKPVAASPVKPVEEPSADNHAKIVDATANVTESAEAIAENGDAQKPADNTTPNVGDNH